MAIIITVKIYGPGAVHAYRQPSGTTTWIDMGIVTNPATSMPFELNDRFRFTAEPSMWGTFVKFCDIGDVNCVNTPTFEGIVAVNGEVNAYFDWNLITISAGVASIAALGYIGWKYVVPRIKI